MPEPRPSRLRLSHPSVPLLSPHPPRERRPALTLAPGTCPQTPAPPLSSSRSRTPPALAPPPRSPAPTRSRPHQVPPAPALTLQAVGVEQVLALLVALDAALGAAHALPRDAPQQPFALVAVGGRGGRPHLEVVRRSARNGVD